MTALEVSSDARCSQKKRGPSRVVGDPAGDASVDAVFWMFLFVGPVLSEMKLEQVSIEGVSSTAS